jgi:hypothetical protein
MSKVPAILVMWFDLFLGCQYKYVYRVPLLCSSHYSDRQIPDAYNNYFKRVSDE